MSERRGLPRRDFLKQATGIVATGAETGLIAQAQPSGKSSVSGTAEKRSPKGVSESGEISFPRQFEHRNLKMISFPLGGVAAGSIGLGGRGQLRDWEIFNRPNQGFCPAYAFPAIWAQSGNSEPVARVLESRILPPYQGEEGLGSNNAPGLSRLEAAVFSGEFPLAHIAFSDGSLPVHVELDAFSPFIPHEPDDSGLPIGLLRYRISNPGSKTARVGIVFSIENPVTANSRTSADKCLNEYKKGKGVEGLLMSNPGLEPSDPMCGSFVLAALAAPGIDVTYWRGWPKAAWWTSPLLFWDEFSGHGKLGPEPNPHNSVGALCQGVAIPPGESRALTFLLAWHFPNRTPEWCGWAHPPGEGKTIIGNFYAERFRDAWAATQYTADNLDKLESQTRLFVEAFRGSTLPDVVKEAASANLSTLVTTTCFRTADGAFHGFEGSNNSLGCCFGNCTHVWNYETVTPFLFPAFARSLREVSFGYSEDEAGGIRAREFLPKGKPLYPLIAADGQMGQIIHAYLDWKLSGDNAWLQSIWPRIKKAIAFAWEPGGWDPNHDGVLTGAQHNTYDVEFYGPNPMCGIYYLGALRASEEMARFMGDDSSANQYRKLFEQGSRWIDANLFNGEFYIQHIRGIPKDRIAPHLVGDMGSKNTEHPKYQVGAGCLIDQLVGQYLANVANLGPLVSSEHIRFTMEAIYKYNYKRNLFHHDNVARTFALNGEAAMVICDYLDATRPHVPFPYFSEVMTGFEYTAAALMIYCGMVNEGIECIRNIRARYDGEKRNPWDEAECGHHYARAMASWTAVVALSGFQYDGPSGSIVAIPRLPHRKFQCFWSTATGWGVFSYTLAGAQRTRFSLKVLAGRLSCNSCEISASGSSALIEYGGKRTPHSMEAKGKHSVLRFDHPLLLSEGHALRIEVRQ